MQVVSGFTFEVSSFGVRRATALLMSDELQFVAVR
jgi:hypothetical protein